MEGDVELVYSIGNTGNEYLILKELMVIVDNPMAVIVEVDVPSEAEALSIHQVPKQWCKQVPSIIKPGHIKLIKLGFTEKAFKEASVNGGKSFVQFGFVSPRGIFYEVYHDITSIDDKNHPSKRLSVWRKFDLSNNKFPYSSRPMIRTRAADDAKLANQ